MRSWRMNGWDTSENPRLHLVKLCNFSGNTVSLNGLAADNRTSDLMPLTTSFSWEKEFLERVRGSIRAK